MGPRSNNKHSLESSHQTKRSILPRSYASSMLFGKREPKCNITLIIKITSNRRNKLSLSFQTDISHIAFNDTQHPFFKHPTVVKLHQLLKLEFFAGYISLINPYKSTTKTEQQPTIDDDPNDWILFDLRFGMPLVRYDSDEY